jgi:hypothetical protein
MVRQTTSIGISLSLSTALEKHTQSCQAAQLVLGAGCAYFMARCKRAATKFNESSTTS